MEGPVFPVRPKTDQLTTPVVWTETTCPLVVSVVGLLAVKLVSGTAPVKARRVCDLQMTAAESRPASEMGICANNAPFVGSQRAWGARPVEENWGATEIDFVCDVSVVESAESLLETSY